MKSGPGFFVRFMFNLRLLTSSLTVLLLVGAADIKPRQTEGKGEDSQPQYGFLNTFQLRETVSVNNEASLLDRIGALNGELKTNLTEFIEEAFDNALKLEEERGHGVLAGEIRTRLGKLVKLKEGFDEKCDIIMARLVKSFKENKLTLFNFSKPNETINQREYLSLFSEAYHGSEKTLQKELDAFGKEVDEQVASLLWFIEYEFKSSDSKVDKVFEELEARMKEHSELYGKAKEPLQKRLVLLQRTLPSVTERIESIRQRYLLRSNIQNESYELSKTLRGKTNILLEELNDAVYSLRLRLLELEDRLRLKLGEQVTARLEARREHSAALDAFDAERMAKLNHFSEQVLKFNNPQEVNEIKRLREEFLADAKTKQIIAKNKFAEEYAELKAKYYVELLNTRIETAKTEALLVTKHHKECNSALHKAEENAALRMTKLEMRKKIIQLDLQACLECSDI